jgi:aminopeptidase N
MMMSLWLLFLSFLLFLPQANARQMGEPAPLDYSLDVSIDLPAAKVEGVAKIGAKKGRPIRISRGDLRFAEVRVNDQTLPISDRDEAILITPSKDTDIEIRFSGIFKLSETSFPPIGKTPSASENVIEKGEISLTRSWYPEVNTMCIYRLTVTLPEGFEAVSEGETVQKISAGGKTAFSFRFPHPLDSLHLIASDRYEVSKDFYKHIPIFAYFFPEDGKRARTYIEYTKKYLSLYENLIGNFPYARFSIVETTLPTGVSMPTFTVLGQEVVRLPFIVETSLGHEILHQWFGNYIYVDEDGGNWSEGLTTYLADHLYEAEKGKGWEYRKGLLMGYQSYVNPRNEFPLKDFLGQPDRPSRAIGYGKAAMVFHMLKNQVGEENFFKSLRTLVKEMGFRRVAWRDLQRVFELQCRNDLSWFFEQWVTEKGMAALKIEQVKIKPQGPQFAVEIVVSQNPGSRQILLPITFLLPEGKKKHLFRPDQGKNRLQVLLDDIPKKIILDEDYDIARILADREFPPVIARLLGAEEKTVVLPESQKENYAEVIEAFSKEGAAVTEAGKIGEEPPPGHSLILLGDENPVMEKLYGRAGNGSAFSLEVRKNPWDPKEVVGFIRGTSQEEIQAAFPKIFHYGKYSRVAFEGGRNTEKKVAPSQRGIVREVAREPIGVDLSQVVDLSQIIPRIAEKKIIYVGEIHDRFSHHWVQLEIIRGLHRLGKKVAIGMEMFQQPFQEVIDAYIQGRIDEKEFLRRTEYFQRWRFDYQLYHPILAFARSAGIPVVALNISQEIAEKVGRGGIDSLSPEEKSQVPAQMDFSDAAYRQRLRKVYEAHPDFKGRDFDFFYQAQVLWDEAMAEAIDRFLRHNPDRQMVILAGDGHLSFGSGIPQRVSRRNGFAFSILLNDEDVEKNAADYLLYPGSLSWEPTPKLMVFLKEEEGRLVIEGFSPGSVSEKAGLQKGDRIIALDGTAVSTFAEIRLELLYKTRDIPVKVKIQRSSPDGVPTEMEFQVNVK